MRALDPIRNWELLKYEEITPVAHIEIRVGGCNAVNGPKDKQDVKLFLAGALTKGVKEWSYGYFLFINRCL